MKYRDWRTGGGYIRGIDVSSHQGTINYAKVKSSGIKFAMLRAYGSKTHEDTKMSSYASGFKSVGIPCGSYFFATIGDGTNMSESTTQAYRYADKLQKVFGTGKFGDLTPFIDVEYNETYGVKQSAKMSDVIKWVDNFRIKFESKFNNKVKLGIYASWGFINAFPTNNAIKDMPLWIAKWRTTSIANTGGFTNWVCWQYTDDAYPFSSGQAVGVSSTGLDMNYVESLDDIRPISSLPTTTTTTQTSTITTTKPPIIAPTPRAWLNQNDWISVVWDKPTVTGITRIELWRNVDKPDKIFLGNMSLTDPQFIDRNAPRGSSYDYRIKVFTKDDFKLSAPSNVVQTRNAIATAPTGLVVIPEDKKITLKWNANPSIEGVKSYSVYMNGTKIGVTDKLLYEFLGLTNGTTYNFQVTALNDSGILSPKSATVSGIPQAILPNTPTALALSVNDERVGTLTWSYSPIEKFSHFKVLLDGELYRDKITSQIVDLGVLTPNVNHTFQVLAYDIDGDSSSSQIISYSFQKPAKVQNLRATPSDKTIDLKWDLVTSNTSGNPINIKSYLIHQNGILKVILGDTTSSYTITNLENSKNYSFSIYALSIDDILSDASDSVVVQPILKLPNQPTNLTAPIIDKTTILFKFEHEQSADFKRYEAYLNDKPIPVDQIKKESRYEGARPNFDYTFKVVVFDNDGDFIESGTITQRIDVPQIPTGLNANPKDREIILTWDLNKENFVHHYDIYQNEKVVATVLQGTNTIKIQNLINNAMYSYQIVAVSNNNISSLKSEYVIATPLLDIPNKPKITHHKIIGNGGAEIHWEHLVKEGHSHYNLYRNGFLYAEKIKDKFYQTDFLEKNITHSFQVEAFDYNNDGSGFSNNEYVTIYSEFIEPLSVDVGQISENVKTVQPKLFLCKPNKTTIAILKEASGITFNTRLADLNELIFRIPYFTEINHELVINPYYKELKVRYLIRLEFGKHLEYFIINEINNDSESNSAEIHCFSLGYELKDKSVPNLEEQIFTCHSAFEKALDGQFNWIIGANIKNPDFYWNRESRTFDIQSQTVLDLIIQIATSYNAILVWDTVNRVIDLQNPTIPSENKGLKIKYGKYLKTLSKTSSIDEMVTRLIPVGEDNLSIASVTPNGSNALEDFSFFMEGFSRDLDNFARFYLNSKAVVTNPNDPFYAEQGFTNVPMGAIFKNIDKDTLTLSTRIDTNSVSYGVINAVNLYRKTNDINWLNKARNIAQFLIDRQQTGDFYTARFSFVPNVVDFNSATGLFESQIGEIDLRVQYLTAIALMEINNIDPNNAYTTLLEGILKLCSMAQNNVVKRATTDNEIEEYMVGAIYRALNQSGNATDGVPTYTFTWNQFSISTIDVLAMCWKNYITYFGNATKTDSENTSYIPQDLINNSSIFIYEIYNQGKLTMSTTALPYGFMHYDYADPLNAEGEYVPLAKNMDWIDGIWGDTWFATDLMLWEINGIALLSKYSTIHFDEEEEKKSLLEIANEYRSILFEKRDIENYPNDIMFFDRYSFDGTGGVGEDTSKAITNTALFLSLEKNLDLNIYEKQLKETLIKYQIKDNNELIDGSYQWATDSGLIEMKTVGEIFRALNETNYSTTLTSSTYMSDELCNAILDYQELIEELSPDMQEYLNQKKVLKEELLELELELTSKETELFLVQDNLDRRKAEGSLFYHNIPYGGTPYTISHEIHKDYKYILMAKTNIVGNITVTTNNKTFTFANTDWLLVEKIAFDRTGETQEQRTIHTYNYNIGYTGTTNCILEFQLVRILPQEFDEIGNEIELLNKYNEFNAQLTYDNQLALVNAKKNEIAMIDTNIETLNDKLSLFNNFSQELLLERDLFVIEKEYVDEKISNAEELKNRALDKFQELKYPVVTIEIDIVNFLEVLEEHYNWNKLELGTIVNVHYEKFNINISAKIITIDYDFENKTISLTISNVKDLQTGSEKFIKALYGAVSTSNKVNIEKSNWNKAKEVNNAFYSFVDSEFDATKQKIIAGTNESVEISRRGILIKSDDNADNMLVANASVIAITNDGGKSYKNAITTSGVIGERIIGKIIAGEQLIIENQNGTFRVDSNGVTIANTGLTITGGITKELLSPDINFDTDLSGFSSIYIDTFKDNNKNTKIPKKPTIKIDGTQVQHTDASVSLANVSFEWVFEDDETLESDIDGFMIYIYTSNSSANYSFGSNPKNELTYYVKPNKNSIILHGVPKDLYYNFGVEAYRIIDQSSINILSKDLTWNLSSVTKDSEGRLWRYEGTEGWGMASAHTTESFTGGARLHFKPVTNEGVFFVGLNTDPTTDLGFTSIDYAWYIDANGTTAIYESGSWVASFTYSANDSFEIIYDNFTIKYYQNGSLQRTVNVASNLKLYVDTAFSKVSTSYQVYDIVFGNFNPTTVLKSAIAQTTAPYNPINNTPYNGEIIGTITIGKEVSVKPELITVIRQGQSYDNVTIDSVNGLMATNKANTERTIINSDGFRIQTNVANAGFKNVLYANVGGQLIAEDLVANRLIVNDGTGRELINANKKQINFANFDVVTGQIQATNINLKGMTVTNTGGMTTLSIDENGNVSISGNITMLGGSISWANLNKPTYTANEVGALPVGWLPTPEEIGAKPEGWLPTPEEIGAKPVGWLPTPEEIGARPEDWLPTAEEIMAKPVGWFPTYDEVLGTIGVDKPPKNANNTFNELTNNGNIRGFFNQNGILYINADFIQAGKMRATYLDVKGYLTVTDSLGQTTLAIDSNGNLSMKGTLNGANGTFTGDLIGGSINVSTDITVGQNIRMQYDYAKRFIDKGLIFYDGYTPNETDPTFDTRITGTYLKLDIKSRSINVISREWMDISAPEMSIGGNTRGYGGAKTTLQLYGNVDFAGATVTGLVAKFG